jgi:hypothetical protein
VDFRQLGGKIIFASGEEDMALQDAKNKYTTEAKFVNLKFEAGEEAVVKIVAKVNSDLFEKDQTKVEARVKVTGGLDIYCFITDVASYDITNENVTVNVDTDMDDSNMDMDMSECEGSSSSEDNSNMVDNTAGESGSDSIASETTTTTGTQDSTESSSQVNDSTSNNMHMSSR